MSLVRVSAFSLSLDGFGAGPDQSLQHPLGVGGHQVHQWFFPTRTFVTQVMKQEGGETGPDEDFAARSMAGVGAWILGRNMFAHSRGPWTDDGWQGWWGDEPPYRVPVFVLTHHPREPLAMKGGTTFHFVTEGPEEALRRAREAAGALDVRVGGGVSTVRHYLRTRALDALHLAYSPVYLGRGESLLDGLNMAALGYKVTKSMPTKGALHVEIARG
ncbi:MAG: dihydrofolate reductase family protein [Candidatus Eisenbacteria bacterium]